MVAIYGASAEQLNEWVRVNQQAVENLECSVCGVRAVAFACQGKCKRYFCGFHAHNSNGFCPDCVMLPYPDGMLHSGEYHGRESS